MNERHMGERAGSKCRSFSYGVKHRHPVRPDGARCRSFMRGLHNCRIAEPAPDPGQKCMHVMRKRRRHEQRTPIRQKCMAWRLTGFGDRRRPVSRGLRLRYAANSSGACPALGIGANQDSS